ncbi:MAG: hypothetical protein QOG73_2579 [Acetobacteraceae bacterium]|jgi:hypothetical protein|nr:hypothetical protein [Acetobacteraceae bacterium]
MRHFPAVIHRAVIPGPRPVIPGPRPVIPGLDPGIPADSGGWGDPRIKSGDDGEGEE